MEPDQRLVSHRLCRIGHRVNHTFRPARRKIIQALGDAGKGRPSTAADSLRDIDFAFVDESRDLAAADLKALKLMCSRGVVMAGDAAQAICGLGSPYKRAGIDISGRTRVLRTDFRTTCPIHHLAEKCRVLCGADIEGESVTTHAFREGPASELYRAGTREELMRLLIEQASLFIEAGLRPRERDDPGAE